MRKTYEHNGQTFEIEVQLNVKSGYFNSSGEPSQRGQRKEVHYVKGICDGKYWQTEEAIDDNLKDRIDEMARACREYLDKPAPNTKTMLVRMGFE